MSNKNTIALWEGETKKGKQCLTGNVIINNKKYYVTAFQNNEGGKKPVISGYVNDPADKSGYSKGSYQSENRGNHPVRSGQGAEVGSWNFPDNPEPQDDDVPF